MKRHLKKRRIGALCVWALGVAANGIASNVNAAPPKITPPKTALPKSVAPKTALPKTIAPKSSTRLQADLKRAEAFNDAGRKAFEAGDVEKSIALFRQAVALVPNDISFVANLAWALTKAEQYGEVQKLLTPKIALFPQPQDRKLLNALLADAHFEDGKQLYEKNEYEKAIAHFRAAYAIDTNFRATEAARDLSNIGSCQSSLGQQSAAVTTYRRALVLRRIVKDKMGEGVTLSNLGIALGALGRHDQAIVCYQQALGIARNLKNSEGQSVSLNNLGVALNALGRYDQSASYFQQALQIALGAKDRVLEAQARNSLGIVFNNLGRNDDALNSYTQALAIRRDLKDRAGEGETLNNIGNLYLMQGRYDLALSSLDDALKAARDTKDRNSEGITLVNIGGVYRELGRTKEEIENYEKGLALLVGTEDLQNLSSAYSNLGEAYESQGNLEKAVSYFERALKMARRVQNLRSEATILHNIASTLFSHDLYKEAIVRDEEALRLARAMKDRRIEAFSLANLALMYSASGDREKSISYNHQAIALFRANKDRAGEARTLNNLMVVYQKEKKPNLAIFYGKQSVNKYQEIRAAVSNLDATSQKSFLNSNSDPYRTLADILIGAGRLPEAEQVLQLLKADEFFNFVRRDAKRTTANEPTALTPDEANWVKRYDEIAGQATQIGARVDELAKKRKSGRTPIEETEYQSLLKDQEAINGRFVVFLRDLDADLGATREDKVREIKASQSWQAELDTLQKKDNINAAVIYTLVAADKYRVILLTAQTRQQFEYSISEADLNNRVETLRRGLRNPSLDPTPAAKDIYNIMFCDGKLEAALKGASIQTALWFLDGTLRYVPIAALHDGKNYLVQNERDNVVVTLASEKRGFDKPEAGGDMLGLGVSQPHQVQITNDSGQMQKLDFEGLTAVPDELRGIIQDKTQGGTGPIPGQILLDPAFTAQSLQEALGEGYRTVHIASHFNLQAGDENSSFLLLGNGLPLALSQWQTQMNLKDVDLLTLSACETAVGNITKKQNGNGAEVDSLGEIVQQLGAASVIASLWSVSDSSTQLLMKEFYRIRAAHPELGKANALKQAQQELLQSDVSHITLGLGKNADSTGVGERNSTMHRIGDGSTVALLPFIADSKAPFAHPYYWAPFILIGNWR